MTFRVVNRGDVQLKVGAPFDMDRWTGHRWVKACCTMTYHAGLMPVEPGESSPPGKAPVYEREAGFTPKPGWYRIVKMVHYDNEENAPYEPLIVVKHFFMHT